jgi:hypothetical protein
VSARYRKIDVRLWGDEKFRLLNRDAKLIFLFLLSCPGQTMVGAMRATMPGLACELQMGEREFRAAFGQLSTRGMVKFNEEAGLLWLPNWLRYNRPESPSVVKSWPTALQLLPQCRLKSEIVKKLQVFIGGLPSGWRGVCLHQEQEQEQEQERSKSNPAQSSQEATPIEEMRKGPVNGKATLVSMERQRI